MAKNVWVVFMAAGLLAVAACGRAPQDENTDGMEVAEVTETVTLPVDMHNTANSLDYEGVYEGLLPAADGPGIQTTLTLSPDGTFVWRSEYLDEQDGVFVDRGTYTLTGNVAALEVPGEGVRYAKVEEGRLRLLDQDKKVITGPLADMYVLAKTQK